MLSLIDNTMMKMAVLMKFELFPGYTNFLMGFNS